MAPCAKPHKPAGRTKATTHTTNSGTHISTPGFRYIDPTFFGQHLADFAHWGQISTPPWPVTAIRFNVNWCELNPAPGEYNWAQLDNWMDYATKTGADLLYTFGDTPGWAVAGGSGGCGSSGNLAPDPPAWESFVRALVHHANGRIKYFELWNEWDASWNWAGGVDGMVALANEAAPIIHDANQGLMLLTPSISSYDAGHVLEKFLASIPPSSGVIDIVNIHTYHSAWAQDASPEATLYPLVSFVHEAMKQAGYGSYPLWSTEGGWGDQSYPAYNDPSTERAYVARNDLALLSLGVDRAYWYAFSNPAWGTLWSDSTSSQPGGLTPAGTATNELVRTAPTPGWLAGATLTAPCAKDTTGLWTCEITRPGGYIGRILWVDSGSRTIQTPPGYRTLRTLAGTSASAPPQLTVSTEPVLIES